MSKDNFFFFFLWDKNSKHFPDVSYLIKELKGEKRFINYLIEVKANPRRHYFEAMSYTAVTHKYLY